MRLASVKGDSPRLLREQSCKDFEERRLPRPVRAQEANTLPTIY